MNPTLAPIARRVSRWAGVETESTHGGVTFRIEGIRFAYLTPDGDLAVPTVPVLRDQLLTDGFADCVPGRADEVRYRIRSPADVPGAIRLLRIAYLDRVAGRDPHVTHVERLTPDRLHRLGASTELVRLLSDPRREPGRGNESGTA
jgi:hypothetical protein